MKDQGSINTIIREMQKVFLGQIDVVKYVLCTLLTGGHILIEGVPGVGKTLIGLTLSRLLNLSFRRIQFTNDMLPSDVIGFHMFRKGSIEPELIKGPVFASIVLADEINRTSPKTQSALLEAMQEGRVSIDGITYPLSDPFMIIATQNPIEIAGTFPLPESQLDRFLIKTSVGYPPAQEEKEIILRDIDHTYALNLTHVMDREHIIKLKSYVSQVVVHQDVLDYIISVIRGTRAYPKIELGASPRGGLALKRASQAWAFIHGRNYITPGDVTKMIFPVLSHRIITRGVDPVSVLEEIIDTIPVPV
ncbi:MAG: MoxR family ATPase [Deltaproteobacteria bacterium]|nr:MoxR family ATPase [Deltaproteobacteria bacterium]